jgi:hypothetical protein
MFDQPEPRSSGLSAPMKLMAISVAGMLVSFGLCGVSALGRGAFTGIFSVIAICVFGLSLLGMVSSVLWFIVAAIIGVARR